MGLIRIPGGGWWEFEGEDPPGVIFTSSDQGGDHETVRALLRLVDDADDQQER